MPARPANLDAAFASLASQRPDALLVGADPFYMTRREDIVRLVARSGLAAIYPFREFTEAGGLISYGTNIANSYRQAGIYAGRILAGAKPDDLPVMQPTKFELVINLKTAKALGIDIPPMLHARSDEVIEAERGCPHSRRVSEGKRTCLGMPPERINVLRCKRCLVCRHRQRQISKARQTSIGSIFVLRPRYLAVLSILAWPRSARTVCKSPVPFKT